MRFQNKYLSAFVLLVALILGYRTFLTVQETEFVLVTQFGRPLYIIGQAGLHFKWAFQSASYFDRRLRIYNPRPSEFLTRDKKNIVVDSYVAWKIQNPDRFLQSVGDPLAAEMRLHDIVWSGSNVSTCPSRTSRACTRACARSGNALRGNIEPKAKNRH